MDWNRSCGTLALLESILPKDERGGSSSVGEAATRGEMEKADPLSEINEGAPPSTDSALEVSDIDGEGSGACILLEEKVLVLVVDDAYVPFLSADVAGLANECVSFLSLLKVLMPRH